MVAHQAYNVMNQELFRLQTNQVVKRRNVAEEVYTYDEGEEVEDSSSDSSDSDKSDEDLVTPPKRRNRNISGRGRGGWAWGQTRQGQGPRIQAGSRPWLGPHCGGPVYDNC